MSKFHDLVTRVSYHYEPPPLTLGGVLEIVGGRRMLRLADQLEYNQNDRQYKLTEMWKPTNFDADLYA
jgi:hypothetical protein